MRLTPGDSRNRSHASRTIAHSWLRNLDEIFLHMWLIMKIQFNFQDNIPKSRKRRWMMILYPKKIKTNGNCHEVLKGRRNIFGHFRQSSEVFGKSSEIFGSRWIPVMTRRKSHAFDLEKVGRYINVKFFLWGLSSKHNVVIYKACRFFLKLKLWI